MVFRRCTQCRWNRMDVGIKWLRSARRWNHHEPQSAGSGARIVKCYPGLGGWSTHNGSKIRRNGLGLGLECYLWTNRRRNCNRPAYSGASQRTQQHCSSSGARLSKSCGKSRWDALGMGRQCGRAGGKWNLRQRKPNPRSSQLALGGRVGFTILVYNSQNIELWMPNIQRRRVTSSFKIQYSMFIIKFIVVSGCKLQRWILNESALINNNIFKFVIVRQICKISFPQHHWLVFINYDDFIWPIGILKG